MMDRRTFLKGAVVVASTPTAAFAPPAAVSIAALIDAHADTNNELSRVVEKADEIFARPDRPEIGYVLRSEIGPRWRWEFNHKRIGFREELIEGFDKKVQGILINRKFYGAAWPRYEALIEEAEAEKQRVLAIFDGRQKLYDDWRDQSGLAAVDDETDRLDAIRVDLEDKIVAFRCETLDDVRAKIRHATEEFGYSMSGDHALKLLRNILGEAV